jgi:hypothetical protein
MGLSRNVSHARVLIVLRQSTDIRCYSGESTLYIELFREILQIQANNSDMRCSIS